MEVTDFDYDLPQELIAQTPVEPRDSSRLLVMDKKTGELEHRHFFNLPEYLKPGDVLVFNDTRVIPARLHGFKTTGAHVEVFLLTRKNATDWEVLVKPGKKLQKGAQIKFSDELSCEILETTDFGGRIARFHYDGIFEEILDRLGETPLPPYIHEKLQDKERYQTVYNRERGSAAAPTAGLHFTKELLQKIRDMGVEEVFVTLHVGLGTFRPVNESRIEDHKMHREFYTVSQEAADAINKAKREGRRIIAVGTTSVRTLESAGASGEMKAGGNWTSIFIYPGYQFRFVDALVTNFHLPQSTLIMLVSALSTRENILHAYKVAVQEKYRFFSFGDAMFIH
ncbi:tRNA preQ1(34) S-adenosylmethionine ribosyltransferase-isomerase QueA [Acidaminococcus fermentans]|jgi:S-adenosylmethionine:tRNA ribosyltransferase-isomerase|uniref:tRNA preQ1(34) S-adenosylmethionine ribosyltransferase-isomerase QueA n=1 Tax=Acidaminococcus TaxID=904 RepID=UPI00242F092E|nr:tRNA preQ1(34) S-adenosylmethionine ribosyltransferase-isomerase QueA [Acidaminococcus fermentans]MEE1598533.1 tRNA preQ1(34) S-adenosylmethionine ribosyltransferase-isomerase QueA [Acidaminococcus fermentans]MEE4122795.1 tRNA preQ1(34) S-adenosylmethionine ribosyltransferase-isomerase QueA [Acidaminococcus fermentans]